MAQGPDGNTIIIVKKVVGHGGHHGGSWKVAYADLVTSMMALFLVLWLVSSSSHSTREAIASYFRRPGVFELGSGTPLEIGGGGILDESFSPSADSNSAEEPQRDVFTKELGEGDHGTQDGVSPMVDLAEDALQAEQRVLQEAMNQINEQLESDGDAIAGLLGDVEVTLDHSGLHIEIMDTKKASMFAIGSAKMLGQAEAQLAEIGSVLTSLPNRLDIEGHTDARPFRAGIRDRYDNWDLSTDRANAARRVFESVGMSSTQLSRLVGFADQKLKKPEAPTDPSNRRISITVRYTDKASELYNCPQLVNK